MKSNKLENRLRQFYWNKQEYINIAKAQSINTKNSYWMKILKNKAKGKKVLDVGCGDGTRLKQLVDKKGQFYGLEISKLALSLAQKKYTDIKFVMANAAAIPFQNSYFDLVYSAYALEHFTSPQKAINEMIRVTKGGGEIVLIAPNYGSPLIHSPFGNKPRFIDLLLICISEINNIFKKNRGLKWEKVQPRFRSSIIADDDIVNKPYLLSLVRYLKYKSLSPTFISSGFEKDYLEISNLIIKSIYLFFNKLKLTKLYPIKYWGPLIFVVVEKS